MSIGSSHVKIEEKYIPGRQNSECNDQSLGINSVHLRNCLEATVVKTQ
jgi:hypothetical protein